MTSGTSVNFNLQLGALPCETLLPMDTHYLYAFPSQTACKA